MAAICQSLPRHMTSTFHVAYFKEDMFGRSIYPPSLTVLAFVCEKLGREGVVGGGGGASRPQRINKSTVMIGLTNPK